MSPVQSKPGAAARAPSGKQASVPQALAGSWAPTLDLNGRPKYVALSESIEQGMADGDLPTGLRLPPQRDIARYLGVTIATVTKAISLASSKGLVLTKAGSGTFIASPNHTYEHTSSTAATQDLSLNAPPVSIVEDILRDNLSELAGRHSPSGAFDYSPIPGDMAHRMAACKWIALRGLTVSPDDILITQGAHEALLACLSALTQPGDAILCERLNYTGLRRIGQLLRIKLIGVGISEDGLSEPELTDSIRQYRPKAIVCTPVTHNPTTVTYSARNRSMLCKLAMASGIPIIEDDIYGLFSNDHATPPLMAQAPENTILVTSLSKTIAAGLRIGYIAAGMAWAPKIRDSMFMLGWTAPTLQMGFATRLIESGRALDCIDRHRQEARQRVHLARRILGNALLTRSDTPSYHVWVGTGAIRPDDLGAELYREGIQVSPASHFLIGEGAAPHALRLSLGRAAGCQMLELPLQLIAHRISAGGTSALGSIA